MLRFHLKLMCLVMLLFAAHSTVTFGKARELDDTRWTDRAHGVSIRPPLGTRLFEQTGDSYLVRIIDDQNQFQITVAVKQSSKNLPFEPLLKSAAQQMAKAHPLSKRFAEIEIKAINRSGKILYFKLPQANKKDGLVGQAFLMLHDRAVIMVELHCAMKDADSYRPTFEAMLKELQVADQKEIAKKRKMALQESQQWIEETFTIKNRAKIHKTLRPLQYFRVLDGRRDIGYMRIKQFVSEVELKNGLIQPGIQIEIQMRMLNKNLIIDTLAKLFWSDDNSVEVWTVTSTYQQKNYRGKTIIKPRNNPNALNNQPGRDAKRSFWENGVRSGENIEITVRGPNGTDKLNFKKPAKGYLSQVAAKLLPLLLPNDRSTTYGFYWYDSSSNKMRFRTEKITPTISGFVMTTRISPTSPMLRSTYDSKRNLVEQNLSVKKKIVATDAQTILRIWQTR